MIILSSKSCTKLCPQSPK